MTVLRPAQQRCSGPRSDGARAAGREQEAGSA